jgi:zinc protease
MTQVEKAYKAIKPEATPPPVTTVEPAQVGEKRIDFHKVAQLPALMAGYKIPAGNNPDIVPLQVAGKVLFDGESSRLYRRLVYNEQKAIFVEGAAMVLHDPSLFYVAAQATPGSNIDSIKAEIFEEIDRMKSEPISADELQKAKNQMESDFINGLQSNEGRASEVGSYQIDTDDYNNIYKYPDKIQAVTADEVMRVAAKYLNENQRTVINLIPTKPPKQAPPSAPGEGK